MSPLRTYAGRPSRTSAHLTASPPPKTASPSTSSGLDAPAPWLRFQKSSFDEQFLRSTIRRHLVAPRLPCTSQATRRGPFRGHEPRREPRLLPPPKHSTRFGRAPRPP